jgi:Family of unknown function (DUF6726)
MVRVTALLVFVLMLQGCVFTKVVTVPMRVTGAVVSIVPGIGNTVHDSIDKAANLVDDVPI